jgi:hypothetical protein
MFSNSHLKLKQQFLHISNQNYYRMLYDKIADVCQLFCLLYFPVQQLTLCDNWTPFCIGEAIPRRMLPPEDAVEYYTNPANRGYLADPEKISWERLVLAQKYGYQLPILENDPDYAMLNQRKDPRQIFLGLEPGWVVNLRDCCILKPTDEQLREFYRS